MPKCPVCGSSLIEEGYPDELGFQKYRCPNGCKFKTPLIWRIKNTFAIFFILILYLLGMVIAILLRILMSSVNLIVNLIKRWCYGRRAFERRV